MTANFRRRNCATACRSPLRIGQNRRRPPELRRWRRQRHSLGSFGPRNKRGYRRSAQRRERNRSPRVGCRSPHSKPHHRVNRRSDPQHWTEEKQSTAPRRQVSGRETDVINFSSIRSFFLSARGRSRRSQAHHSPPTPQVFNTQVSLRFLNAGRILPPRM